jgi:hypothetical protein
MTPGLEVRWDVGAGASNALKGSLFRRTTPCPKRGTPPCDALHGGAPEALATVGEERNEGR